MEHIKNAAGGVIPERPTQSQNEQKAINQLKFFGWLQEHPHAIEFRPLRFEPTSPIVIADYATEYLKEFILDLYYAAKEGGNHGC